MAGLVLGGVSFSGFEIPNQINFGGKHNVTVHELIGGNRVLDAMGSKPDQITWSGRFRGRSAISRAQAIDEMRIGGAEIGLSWLNLFRTVVVVGFVARTEKAYEVSYDITCEVVNDRGASLGGIFQTIDSLIGGDILSASAFSDSTAASSIVATLTTSLAATGPLTGSTAATRVAAAQAAAIAINALAATFTAEETKLGQAIPIDNAQNMAAWLTLQAATALAHSATIDAAAYIKRIGSNIATVKL